MYARRKCMHVCALQVLVAFLHFLFGMYRLCELHKLADVTYQHFGNFQCSEMTSARLRVPLLDTHEARSRAAHVTSRHVTSRHARDMAMMAAAVYMCAVCVRSLSPLPVVLLTTMF